MSDQELVVNSKMQKLPPQVVDIEKCVLGALMLEKDSITVIVDVLKADYFYDPANRKIFSAILDLFNANLPIVFFISKRSRRELSQQLTSSIMLF